MSIVKNKFVCVALLLVQLYLPRTCFSQNIDLCNKADNSSKIVVAGGINIDRTFEVNRLPVKGETIMGMYIHLCLLFVCVKQL